MTINAMVDQPVSAYFAVVLIGGFFRPADPTNMAHIGKVAGISQQSVAAGPLSVVEAGELHGVSTLTPDARYYVGAGGQLSTVPTFGGALWSKCVGFAKTVNTLIVDLQPSIARA